MDTTPSTSPTAVTDTGGATTAPTRSRRRLAAVAVPVTLLVSGAMVWGASNAAFTATTQNDGNSWAAGTVVITDNDADSALFTAANIQPGWSEQHCIVVDYTGSLASNVKFYTTPDADNELYDFLEVTVERGTGTANNCGDFVSTETVYPAGFMSDLAAADTWAEGLGTWAPIASQATQTATYRVNVTLPDLATVNGQPVNDAQGASATMGFVWEARNQ